MKILISFFILGFSFGIGPCLASCGPLLISYVAGTKKNMAKSGWVYLLFSASRILVYIALSLVIFFFGRIILGAFARYFSLFGGLFIIIIGLLIMLGKNPNHKFCSKMQGFFLKRDSKTVIILGLVMGILPCAPLISVTSYIGLIAKDWTDGLLYALCFGLGTVASPLFVLVMAAGLLTKIKPAVYRAFNFICGLIIVFLGLQLIRRAL